MDETPQIDFARYEREALKAIYAMIDTIPKSTTTNPHSVIYTVWALLAQVIAGWENSLTPEQLAEQAHSHAMIGQAARERRQILQ